MSEPTLTLNSEFSQGILRNSTQTSLPSYPRFSAGAPHRASKTPGTSRDQISNLSSNFSRYTRELDTPSVRYFCHRPTSDKYTRNASHSAHGIPPRPRTGQPSRRTCRPIPSASRTISSFHTCLPRYLFVSDIPPPKTERRQLAASSDRPRDCCSSSYVHNPWN
ncbi:hypothetical protein BV25DRAFT_691475 [Artomyces pyxidatus]|uniref:Uncharacterized protein n=1 Tax=Artomyces pyxidatus TaxID=48021 RepID=A0ACB8T0Z9_9AGAM|nr:hypothetical protein BV25DRAFT_691475 [Artomyces pyxidatus]